MTITQKDRRILRELAKRQAEAAALPVMAERKKLWYDLNDGKPGHPLVIMEYHGLESDVYPPLECEDEFARRVEVQMARRLFKHETFKDDRVIPNVMPIMVRNRIQPFGYRPKSVSGKKADGASSLAYAFRYAVTDFEADFDIFKLSVFEIDAGLVTAKSEKAAAEEIIGDIIPVRIEMQPFTFFPGNVFVSMMGMETMFCSMYDYPELFHKAMRRLTDDYLSFLDAAEAGGAVVTTNESTGLPWDSYCYANDLPGEGALDRPVKISDQWGYSNSQETVGVSAEMYDEFFFTYIKEFASHFGLFSYGCCEPVNVFWERCLSKITNLRKISISPWCDEEYMGEALRGKKIVYNRKPSPQFTAVDETFDENALMKHLEKTVKAASGCPLEITFRDICTVRGEPWRLARAVELTRGAFARWYKS